MAGQPARLTIPRLDRPADQDARRQRRDRRDADLHLLGREPGRLLAPRPDAAPPLRSGRGRADPSPRRGPRPLPADRRAPSSTGPPPRWRPGRTARASRPEASRRRSTGCSSSRADSDHVQDLGRFGHQRVGVPPSGPMDRAAFLVANRLVGNPDGAAALECTIKGPRLEVRQAVVVAVTGAPMGFTVNGQEARPGPPWASGGRRPRVPDGERRLPRVPGRHRRHRRPAGARLPRDLLRGRLGGLGGRALQKGDALPVGAGAGRGREGATFQPRCGPRIPRSGSAA